MLSAHTQRNMASFAEAPAGDVAKGTSRHARTRGASTRALEGGRARPPARSPQLIPSVPILDVCFHRREDLQDQVRAVPRRRGRRRPQAGARPPTASPRASPRVARRGGVVRGRSRLVRAEGKNPHPIVRSRLSPRDAVLSENPHSTRDPRLGRRRRASCVVAPPAAAVHRPSSEP